jgi:hypothetical protein
MELSKDLSSFANADGGTIIYGVVEENHLPKNIDTGFDPLHVKREWLEDVVDSNTKPKIDRLKIKQIILRKTTPGKVIYVVHIPPSLQGAIQAKDYRYYQRRNYKAELMEDYQVRDVMNRFKYPIIVPEISCKHSRSEPSFEEYDLIICLMNKGVVAAKAFGLDLLLPFTPAIFLPDYLPRKNLFAPITPFRPDPPFTQYAGYKIRNADATSGDSFSGVLFPSEKKYVAGAEGGRRLVFSVKDADLRREPLGKIYITTYGDDMPPRQFEHDVNNLLIGK